ncbi:Late embryogenesis abundant (LEA) hydroxyproline-rich glycoproteinfamily [Zostera marina]|uniref:Late embryogenesis abundant (LEA) hydroxyproline-rich glycoproteinfamily n=1 Tax=Zostera marina TaxID=29655 RepID=A0A0K9P682_ZOSMR|nr:Late embryogenesis abundant (LEA) hydroxyproline-rich glycoproteinfamily [Zostera marina]
MAERIYPSSKPMPQPPPPTTTGRGPPTFPPPKSQLYNASRPMYRPQPPKQRQKRRSRSCFCCCFLWTILFLVGLIFLFAIASGIFYVIYRPEKPTFYLSSARLSSDSHLNLTVTSRNPNKKIAFVYAPISVSTEGAFLPAEHPGFVQKPGSVKVVRVDPIVSKKKELKGKKKISVIVTVETKVGVEIGSLKTKQFGVTVICDGISVPVPAPVVVSKGENATKLESPPTASVGGASCNVKLRIKIWKWNF